LAHLRPQNDLGQAARIRKHQSKKKENFPTDVPVVVSDRDYDTGPEEDDYMITEDKWKELIKSLRNMVKGLIAKGNFIREMAYKGKGMTISATVPKDLEIEEAKQFTDMIEW
jgi:hypothetical protein